MGGMENRKFWSGFIELYRNLPCLWNVKSKDYTNRILKIHAYEQLIKKLKEIYPSADRKLAVAKINNIRTNYRRDRKKIQECLESGEPYVSTLWYYELMTFLDDEQQEDDGSVPSRAHKVHKLITKTNLSNSRKRKPLLDEDDLIKLATKKLTSNENDECTKIARGWGAQYKEMESRQKIFARKLVSDILFLGCMGELDMSHVIQIQDIFVQRTTSVNVKIERNDNDDGFDSEIDLLAS